MSTTACVYCDSMRAPRIDPFGSEPCCDECFNLLIGGEAAAISGIDVVLDAIERGEASLVVVLPDPADALCHPGKPGTNGRYCGGCRCIACRAAHATYVVAWKRAKRARVAS